MTAVRSMVDLYWREARKGKDFKAFILGVFHPEVRDDPHIFCRGMKEIGFSDVAALECWQRGCEIFDEMFGNDVPDYSFDALDAFEAQA